MNLELDQENPDVRPVSWRASFASSACCLVCAALLVLTFWLRLEPRVYAILAFSLFSPLCASIMLFAFGGLFSSIIPFGRIKGVLVITLPIIHCGLTFTISLLMIEKSNPILEPRPFQAVMSIWQNPTLLFCLLGLEILFLSSIGLLKNASNSGNRIHE